jgi:pyruvate,water dikinase
VTDQTSDATQAATEPAAGPAGEALALDLADVDGSMLADVGGKAANLGRLLRAGLPVPPGFCVTTASYGLVAGGAGLDRALDELAVTPAADTERLAELAGRARSAILKAPVPPAVAAAVARAYARLGAGTGAGTPVAVRSSATAEDLPDASFAGQQDTYLNVVGEDAVVDAVRRCWASLWTDRAVAYRATNGVDHRAVRLAVVVQRMVDATAAGVLFTANPVTGARGQAVVDASPGLGEAVVSGAVNPDHFVVDIRSGAVLERRLGDKRVAIRALPGGGTERVELDGADGAASLTDEQLRGLVALGLRAEGDDGVPQDTEWAVDAGGTLWLTQARPITTLYPLPAGAPGPGGDLRVYFCFTLAQGLTRPITPMGLAAIRLIASSVSGVFGRPVPDPVAGPGVFVEAGWRGFVDVTAILRSRAGRELMPRVLDVMEARSATVLRRLFDDPRLAVVRDGGVPIRRSVLRLVSRFNVPGKALQAVRDPDRAVANAGNAVERLRADLAPPAGVTLTGEGRLDHVERLLSTRVFPLLPTVAPAAVVGFVMLGLAGRLLRDGLEPDELQTVLRGLPNNVTTEMDLRLWGLAARVRADPGAAAVVREHPPAELAARYRRGDLPPTLRRELDDFLRRDGDRAVAEIDVGVPRWSDDPTYVLGVVANYLRLDDPDLAPDAQFARGAAQAEAMVARLVAKARRRGRLRGRVVGVALDRARRLAGLREMPKYLLVVAFAEARRQLSAVGAELAGAGTLAAPDDVFFLDLAEARAALRGGGPSGAELRGLVAARRDAYDRELRRRHVPRVLLSDGTEPEALAQPGAAPGDANGGTLTGTPASAGTVSGTARVVLDPVGAHLEPGEILVAPSTDPGWTPLFLTAGGLVMEMGGANSHGAVVAREYGIPAVVGVPDATSLLTTGQRITVDGAAGIVTPD